MESARGTLPQSPDPEWQGIIDFWKSVRLWENAGETTWEELDAIEFEVARCREKRDLAKARRLTARAIFLTEFGGG